MNAMPTILIFEPHALFRQALITTIQSRFPELTIIESETAEDALKNSIVRKPHLVLMDIHLGNGCGQGLKLLRDIAARQPNTRIAVITDSDDDEYRKAAFQRGADYFISKVLPNEGKKILSMIKDTLMET